MLHFIIRSQMWDIHFIWHIKAVRRGRRGCVLQAGMFFLKHADAVEGELPTSELHGILLLALQWLSGSFNNSSA